jgi:hypothetical protein
LHLVYGTVSRESEGDMDAAKDAAKDATQLVFVELARKAASLAGWLSTSVR